jgi:hypothetical protein
MHCPSHPPWFHHPNNIRLIAQVMKLLIVELPSSSCYFYLPFIIIIISVPTVLVRIRTLATSYRRFHNLLRHTVGLLWTSDQSVAKASTYKGQHSTESQRQTFKPRAGFEPKIPITKRPRPTPYTAWTPGTTLFLILSKYCAQHHVLKRRQCVWCEKSVTLVCCLLHQTQWTSI